MSKKPSTIELSIDDVSDTFAPDVAGKQEALEIVRPLGVKRARFVLRKANGLKEKSRIRDMRNTQEKAADKKSALPGGNNWFLRSAVSNYQFWYGPLGGDLGKVIIAALYLNAHRDQFSTWMKSHNVDSACCLAWVDEKVASLRVVVKINGDGTNILDMEGLGLSESAVPRSSGERHGAHDGGYGEEGSRMLAGLFLLEDQNNYILWSQEQGFDSKHPMAWAERQANDFRQLIGPDVKLPACQYPEME